MESSAPAVPTRKTVVTIALLGLLVAALTAPAVAQSDDPTFDFAQTQVDVDAILLAVDLQSDGDAQWRIEYRTRLDDENTTAAFDDLQQDVQQNESAYVSRFDDRMTTTVQDAATTTGREMSVRNVSVSTTTQQLPQEYGVLIYTFEWTNFAVDDGDQLQAGDALAGLFLDADSALQMTWPEGYSLVEVSPEPTETRDRGVVWRGPTDFDTDDPTLVVTTAGPTQGVNTSLVGLGIVAIVLLGGGAFWWWRYRAGDGGSTGPIPAVESDDGAQAETAGAAAEPPDELLSNEERVIALLEQHGGRMKQQDVVEQLGWTDAKTSQVVSKLRDAGDLEGFRLGRENVLRLPEVDESPAPADMVSEDEDADHED